LIGCGIFTRILGMADARYTNVALGKDWLRTALYLIIFIALIFTGAGRFSVDNLRRRKNSTPSI
jgi:uncharacterized membrane protein YphA (DoxX/SURF4 family)